jgi:hypothetical protein
MPSSSKTENASNEPRVTRKQDKAVLSVTALDDLWTLRTPNVGTQEVDEERTTLLLPQQGA